MRSVALGLVVALAVSGCARFDDRLDSPFTPAQGPGMGAPPPSAPPGQREPDQPPTTSEPAVEPAEPGPCDDPDPAVIATCLEPAVAVAGIGEKALLAEEGGRIRVVSVDADPEDFGRVDPRGGRVAAVAPSPDFAEDRLVYVLVVGDGPTRIERLARGDAPRTVAELAPAASGGLAFVDDLLTVAVGGELLRFPDFTGVGRAERPEILARDLGEVRGLCTVDGEVFLTASTGRGVVARTPDRVVWTWPEQRAVGGCAALPDSLSVALPDAERVDTLATSGGAAQGQPESRAEERYGRLTGLTALTEGLLLAGTTNKDGGEPVATDDRAVILPDTGGGGEARV
ncbi:oxidoreductase [Dietzia sp. 179-F 9C3 NHS]|uniref:oxidoreductase n=1 Tax=Dietzia sp. 179-F 9C3 NHS TaxID=3374295 RepID=UPI00387A567E